MNILDLQRKAESGSGVAQCVLGIAYLDGVDVAVDYDKAFRLLTAAAAQGRSRAVLALARMHANGLGVPVNLQEAIRLYETVGRVEFLAAIELGRIYSRGVGIPTDPSKASSWYQVAVALGCESQEGEEILEAKQYLERDE